MLEAEKARWRRSYCTYQVLNAVFTAAEKLQADVGLDPAKLCLPVLGCSGCTKLLFNPRYKKGTVSECHSIGR